MTQHVDVDLDGNPIGQHSFEVWREYDASKIPLEDRDAQFGVDILTPTVELEIQMPPGSFQNYLPPAELAQLAGTVNTGNFIVGARPHAKPAIIPEGYCLYHGCQLDPVLIEANKFAWIHRFSIGSMLLPGGISAMMHDGTPWTKLDLPIRYAYWTAYGAKNKAGDFIDVDGDGNLIGLEEGDDYMQRVPKALVIAPVYAYGGNFNARLGII